MEAWIGIRKGLGQCIRIGDGMMTRKGYDSMYTGEGMRMKARVGMRIELGWG